MRCLLRSTLTCSLGVGTIVALTALQVAGQSAPAAPKKTAPAKAWTPAKTVWGDPDLQGIWSYATITPLERPTGEAGKEFLTDDEAAAINSAELTRADRRSSNAVADVELA